MKYYLLEPEVAGGFGNNTVIDHDVKPFRVDKLHYEFEGWLGDDLLETSPCIIGTEHLVDKIKEYGFSGYSIDDVEISKSYEFSQFYPDTELPKFYWIKIHGMAGKEDFGLSENRSLIISDRVLDVLKTFKISNCDIKEYEYSVVQELEMLIAECRVCAEKHGDGIKEGDSLRANLNYNKLEKLFQQLQQFGEEGKNAILSLTEDENPSVRCWAATHSINYNEKKAKKVLKKLSKEKDIIGFDAKMVLQEWKKGNLRLS